jgi:hypothetical protein
MKVTFITTINRNVGDDFTREGIIYLLKKRFADQELFFQNIHKHSPITARYGFEWFRDFGYSKPVDYTLPLALTRDRVLEADLLVQSGAPVYYLHKGGPNCSNNEWFYPLIERRYIKIKNHAPFINLAAGSCQRYYSDGTEFQHSKKDIDYIRKLHSLAKVTTVRDHLAKKILNNLGLDAPVIPCPSIFAKDNLDIESSPPEFVVLNYMRGGAHYSFGQNIDPIQWEQTFRKFYNQVRKEEQCVFVCHDQEEANEAYKIDPNANVFLSKDYVDYIKFYSKAKYGIMGRVHGAFVLASFGRPSFVIGTDTRAHMAQEIGLRHAFVNNVDLDSLMLEYQYLKNESREYRERFNSIKEKACQDYQKALSQI